jgi:hypothetical protein
MLPLRLLAVQFFSRPVSRPDYVLPKASLTTREGRSLDGYLTIRVGSPLLVGASESMKARPNYAQPWETQEGKSIGAVQWVDPYAEIRWPSYAIAAFSADVTPPVLGTAAECDIVQRMRTLVGFEIFEFPELKAMTDQLLASDGYRFGYWTRDLDFFSNPVPAPGKYINADRNEPVGPGHASLFGFEFEKDSNQLHQLACVWSQSFSLPKRTNSQVDDATIRRRAQEIKRHYNSKDELMRAQKDLRQRNVKGCIRSAASAVDAALNYYCAEWGVVFPKAPIPFDEKIENILQQAGRPSFRCANPGGLLDILHLYRSRNAMHEGDCYYRDDTLGIDVYCDISHAGRFFNAAQTFAYWLDSQA